jgi:hypothetical protein
MLDMRDQLTWERTTPLDSSRCASLALSLRRLGDGRHRLGRSALLAAAAASSLLLLLLLLLGLLDGVHGRQEGEGLRHGRLAWRSGSLLQIWAGQVVVQVVAEEVCVADEGAGGAAVAERASSGPGRVGGGGATGGVERVGRVVAVEGTRGRRHGADGDGYRLGGRGAG